MGGCRGYVFGWLGVLNSAGIKKTDSGRSTDVRVLFFWVGPGFVAESFLLGGAGVRHHECVGVEEDDPIVGGGEGGAEASHLRGGWGVG